MAHDSMLHPAWPNGADWLALVVFLAIGLAIPVAGCLFLFRDVRRWTRRFRRALAIAVNYLPHLPNWARRETPGCVAALGLRMPCTTQDVKRAYREKVKELHPDRGGDKRRFLRLQSQFEQAMSILESQ